MTIEEELIELFDKMAEDPRFNMPIKKVVTNLWQERDDCRERLMKQAAHIDELRERNGWLSNELIEQRKTHAKDQTTIDELKDVMLKDGVIECLESKIVRKDKALAAAREIIGKSERRAAQYKEQNEVLEAELSVRKQDSDVLLKVVEAVRTSDTEPYLLTVNKVKRIVEDYLNAPEQPIEEKNYITVKIAYPEMP